MNTIGVNDSSCIRCGRCVKVCPSQIFVQEKAGGGVTLHKPENCILCGHCVAACPTGSVNHAEFPAERVHAVDYGAMPTPEQVELLLAVRRSNRAFSQRPVPQEYLDRIVAAADRAPTATNARQLGYTLVTDAAQLRAVTEYTLGRFRQARKAAAASARAALAEPHRAGGVPLCARLRTPAARDMPEAATACCAVRRLCCSSMLRRRTGSVRRTGTWLKNASLTAESLGVSQIYMGFVLTALRQDRAARLNGMLGLEGRRICAVMALGMPQFRYPNYIDRTPAEVTRK